jgi:toxin-antitoxin system PIN domain toxin
LTALPDVNVLLALAWSHHPHHTSAQDWFRREGSAAWATCLLSQAAFRRLSLNPQIVNVAIDCHAAVALLAGLVSNPGHRFIAPSVAWTESALNDLVLRIVGYRQITDATLLAIAKSENLKLVTFDQALVSICPWPAHPQTLPP